MNAAGEELSDKKQGVALGWLATLGPFGVHRFYLGRWISGGLLGGAMLALLVWALAGVVDHLAHSWSGEPGGATIADILMRLGLTAVMGLWPGIDLWLIARGRLTDGRGRRLNR